jgi:mono/diheme cytochrome c family protein
VIGARVALVFALTVGPAQGDENVSAVDAQRAKQNYQLHCMGCHAEDGMGLAGHVPPIRLTLKPLLATAAGREFVLRVPGVAQSSLSSRELADVLNWLVRDFTAERDLTASRGAQVVAPLSAAEVERFRGKPLLDVQGARAQLISTP